MLEYLHIENIAVIEEANIDFSKGFNVMTGETGAGKSIVIDSLFAIMGERTSRELIRHGSNKAVVSASFSCLNSSVYHKLEEIGYPADSDGRIILQRTLFSDGRGQVKINSRPANVSALKEIGKLLINIHGQHDNQTLLDPQQHITFIDAYAENKCEKNEYLKAFSSFRDITKELNKLTAEQEENERKLSLLKYQIEELEKADVKLGEIEELKVYLDSYNQSEKISRSIDAVVGAISGENEDDIYSVLDKLRQAKASFAAVVGYLPGAEQLMEKLETIVLDCEAIGLEAVTLKDKLEFNPEKAENARNRLDFLHSLMLKYGGSEEKALEFLENAKNQLAEINLNNERITELENMLEPAEQNLIEAGKKLTESRKRASAEICKRITEELSFLDFNSACFKAEIESGRYTKNGCDTTEFLISANAGEELKPLAKIASGGELSRIMLAIRSVLSLKDDVDTLIFDEIDSGISGHAAQKVATKLIDVADLRQVICVTHLAQIASGAHIHLFISKEVREGRTYTKIIPLDKEGQIKEIARIMSGGEYTENLLKTAEEMINFRKSN